MKVYDYLGLTLATLYLIFCVFSVVQIIRTVKNHSTHKSNGKSWGYFFYPLVFVGTTSRAAYMLILAISDNPQYVMNEILLLLNMLPTFAFFSGFLVILFCWAKIYHNSFENDGPLKFSKLRGIMLLINGAIFSIAFALYIVDVIKYPIYNYYTTLDSPTRKAMQYYSAALFVMASIGFITYAIRINKRMKVIRSGPEIAKKIYYITIVLVIEYLLRAAVEILDIMWSIWTDLTVELLYYAFLDLVPLCLMMYILKMSSAGKNNDRLTQYSHLVQKH